MCHSVLWPVALNTHSGFNSPGYPGGFAGLLTMIVIGLIVENLIFRTIERNTIQKCGTQS